MKTMMVREKTYCEISVNMWERCDKREMGVSDTLIVWFLPIFILLAVGIEVRKKRLTNVLEMVDRSLKNA